VADVTSSVDKLVVTNFSALKAKYGPAASRVRAALRRLVRADAARGLTTGVVDLSSRRTLRRFGALAVSDPADAVAVKAALDLVCDALAPDYVLLLGGPDVVPLAALRNPLQGTRDPDAVLPSDLPYACPGPASDDAGLFIGPTRVVGRVPDVPEASDPAVLLAAVRTATRWTLRAPAHYRSHLTVGALTWQGSTSLTALRLFGSEAVELSPTAGPDWSADQLARPCQFFNLHGATADPRFFGAPGSAAAHTTDAITDRVAEGTVVVAECCYGGELYDPQLAGGVLPLPLAYLAQGAYGYVGSTTISYGSKVSNAAADLLCRFFLEELFNGASTGRAMLQARQRYVRERPIMTPVDVKTLGQFVLLGDPSVHPVDPVVDDELVSGAGGAGPAALTGGRTARRRNLEVNGDSLARTTPVTESAGSRPMSRAEVAALRELAGRDAAGGQGRAFAVRIPEWAELARPSGAASAAPAEVVVTVRRARRAPRGPQLTMVEATRDGADLTGYRTLYSR
jgi:hypothetical protein